MALAEEYPKCGFNLSNPSPGLRWMLINDDSCGDAWQSWDWGVYQQAWGIQFLMLQGVDSQPAPTVVSVDGWLIMVSHGSWLLSRWSWLCDRSQLLMASMVTMQSPTIRVSPEIVCPPNWWFPLWILVTIGCLVGSIMARDKPCPFHRPQVVTGWVLVTWRWSLTVTVAASGTLGHLPEAPDHGVQLGGAGRNCYDRNWPSLWGLEANLSGL